MKFTITLMILVLLSACTSTRSPSPTVAASNIEHSAKTRLESLRGRISIRINRVSENREEGGTSQFELYGDAIKGSLNLISPFGTSLAQAQWEPKGVKLTTLRGVRDFASLDDLAPLWLKHPLPMAALIEWLRGRPWSGAEFRILPQGFEQLGWVIDQNAYEQGLLELYRAPKTNEPEPTEIWVKARLERNL